MTTCFIVACAWFRTLPWPIRVWIVACTVAGATLGVMAGNWLAGLLASLGA